MRRPGRRGVGAVAAPTPGIDHLVVAGAAGYLAVGAGWLLADRAGLEIAGFGAPFVQLTAIHFTFAGAVGTVLAWQAWQAWRAWRLGASAVSVVVPMLLAVQWAVGANLGTPALSIPVMAATHGAANAVGFCLLGVLGWRRAATGAADAEVR
ncbi:MAG: YndJ family transporter [Nitriliruptor sp.]|uniref:YndJ family transporter n=1 Tax=Nitriliruptor sp. TaxID=2448056 RepID=UPI0034A06F0D